MRTDENSSGTGRPVSLLLLWGISIKLQSDNRRNRMNTMIIYHKYTKSFAAAVFSGLKKRMMSYTNLPQIRLVIYGSYVWMA